MFERVGRAYRWRVTGSGDVYEYVSLSTYRRRAQLGPRDVVAVPTLPRHVFLHTGSGNYVLVHDCVLTTVCPNCGAKKGERCQNKGRPWVTTHWTRRKESRRTG